MRQFFQDHPNEINRTLEIIIPSTSWLLITMPLWLSFWHPAFVAYLIVTFDVYWFYKSLTLAYFAVRSFLTMTAHIKVDWLSLAKRLPHFSTLHHAIIIPEYNEPIHILRRTLENLTKQDFPRSRIIVILAQETKDADADRKSAILIEEFGTKFGKFMVTKHALTSGETAGNGQRLHGSSEPENAQSPQNCR